MACKSSFKYLFYLKVPALNRLHYKNWVKGRNFGGVYYRNSSCGGGGGGGVVGGGGGGVVLKPYCIGTKIDVVSRMSGHSYFIICYDLDYNTVLYRTVYNLLILLVRENPTCSPRFISVPRS